MDFRRLQAEGNAVNTGRKPNLQNCILVCKEQVTGMLMKGKKMRIVTSWIALFCTLTIIWVPSATFAAERKMLAEVEINVPSDILKLQQVERLPIRQHEGRNYL